MSLKLEKIYETERGPTFWNTDGTEYFRIAEDSGWDALLGDQSICLHIDDLIELVKFVRDCGFSIR